MNNEAVLIALFGQKYCSVKAVFIRQPNEADSMKRMPNCPDQTKELGNGR
jgi:hypothetical protein